MHNFSDENIIKNHSPHNTKQISKTVQVPPKNHSPATKVRATNGPNGVHGARAVHLAVTAQKTDTEHALEEWKVAGSMTFSFSNKNK